MRRLLLGIIVSVLALHACGDEGTFDPKAATFEQLFLQAFRPGDSPQQVRWKQEADAELYARGPVTLSNLMDRIHIENVWIGVMAMSMVKDRPLPAEQAVPALVPFLQSPRWQTRKMAAFFLGFYPAAQHASALFPLFDDDRTRGAAVRTLGKWRVTNAVPRIEQCLADRKDRIRTVAANALRDIGDERSIPALIGGLADPVYNVRNVSARALVAFKAPAVEPLLAALKTSAHETATRQIVRVLGDLGDTRALKPLKKLEADARGGLHDDLVRSLALIRKERTDAWFAPGGD